MSENWTTIGEVADVYDGPHATPKKIDEGPIFLGITSLNQGTLDLSQSAHVSEEDFTKWTRRVTPQNGDVVFSYETRLGEAAIIPRGIRCCLGRRMGLLRPKKDKVIPEYLLYAYLAPAFQGLIKARTIHGSTVDRIALKDLPNFPIQIPKDKEDQRAVVEVLKSLDEKIELNRQINQTLEHIAQAIFKSWFVDFEPVKAKNQAKQNGQDPERAAMCAISGKTDAELDAFLEASTPEQRQQLTATAALFPDELEDSDFGPTPKGWSWSTIGEEVDAVGGGTPSTKNEEFWEGGDIHWTTPKDLSGLAEKVLLSTDRKITQAGLGKISSGLLPVDTVLMSSRAPVGYLVLAKVPTAVNQGFIAMKCNKRLTSEYVLQWANSVMDEIKQRASGSTFAEISKKNFRQIPVIVPDEVALTAFSSIAKGIYEQITEGVSESKSLADIRDSLLPRFLSGKITLNRTQTKAEAVA